MQVFVHSYFQRQPLVPEHRDADEIRDWLRSQPEDLSFTEVWRDLVDLLKNKRSFRTLAEGNPYEVAAAVEGLRITINGRTELVHRSELLDFWQQLRVYGFTSRQIAPTGLTRRYSYLMPLFAELPYVKPVRLADHYEQIRDRGETIGLQYVPRPLASTSHPGALFEQSITI